MKTKHLSREHMTVDQAFCYDLLCDVFGGEHHTPPAKGDGDGIQVSVYRGTLATFDFDYLTRVVVLAHDRMVRVAIVQGGPRHVGLMLHRRHTRDGRMTERHPTLEDAAATIRRSVDRIAPNHNTQTKDAADGTP